MNNKKSMVSKLIILNLFIIVFFSVLQYYQGGILDFPTLKVFSVVQLYSVVSILLFIFFVFIFGKWKILKSKEVDIEKKKRIKMNIKINISDDYFIKGYYVFSIALALLLIYITQAVHYIDYYFLNLEKNMIQHVAAYSAILIQVIVYLFFSKYYRIQKEQNILGKFLETFTNVFLVSICIIVLEIAGIYIKLYNLNKIFSRLFLYFYTTVLIYLIIVCIFKLFNKRYKKIDLRIPYLNVLFNGGNPVTNTLNYLEENTGMTMRSLWSVKLIKAKVPVYLIILVGIIWVMTSFVQIKTYEEGAIYRFGKLNEKQVMKPGMHLKFPWPIDKVKILPVDRINFLTIGYEEGDIQNYLWTQGHTLTTYQYDANSAVSLDAGSGSSYSYLPGGEYILLMGNGREAVSINMKVSYKISNIVNYLTKYSNPIKKLESDAYELVMRETVKSNLNDLLTRDRYEFAEKIHQELDKHLQEENMGIDVTQILIMSIHPPLDVAEIYQEVNNARTDKQTMINKAYGKARSAIPIAEMEKEQNITTAMITNTERNALAYSETYLYRYQIEAYNIDRNFFAWRKWLETFEKTLRGKNIYILEEEINQTNDSTWFGYQNFIDGGKN